MSALKSARIETRLKRNRATLTATLKIVFDKIVNSHDLIIEPSLTEYPERGEL
jgi:hypothetical protein